MSNFITFTIYWTRTARWSIFIIQMTVYLNRAKVVDEEEEKDKHFYPFNLRFKREIYHENFNWIPDSLIATLHLYTYLSILGLFKWNPCEFLLSVVKTFDFIYFMTKILGASCQLWFINDSKVENRIKKSLKWMRMYYCTYQSENRNIQFSNFIKSIVRLKLLRIINNFLFFFYFVFFLRCQKHYKFRNLWQMWEFIWEIYIYFFRWVIVYAQKCT